MSPPTKGDPPLPAAHIIRRLSATGTLIKYTANEVNGKQYLQPIVAKGDPPLPAACSSKSHSLQTCRNENSTMNTVHAANGFKYQVTSWPKGIRPCQLPATAGHFLRKPASKQHTVMKTYTRTLKLVSAHREAQETAWPKGIRPCHQCAVIQFLSRNLHAHNTTFNSTKLC